MGGDRLTRLNLKGGVLIHHDDHEVVKIRMVRTAFHFVIKNYSERHTLFPRSHMGVLKKSHVRPLENK